MTSKGLTGRFVGKSNHKKKLLDVPGGREPNINQRKKKLQPFICLLGGLKQAGAVVHSAKWMLAGELMVKLQLLVGNILERVLKCHRPASFSH